MSKRPPTLANTITKEHLDAYLARSLTANDIAALYSVHPNYVYQTIKREPLPPKQLTPTKAQLSAARKLYRLKVSLTTSARLAAEATYTSLRTMYRYKARARQLQAENKL